jgi:hypothetical protein
MFSRVMQAVCQMTIQSLVCALNIQAAAAAAAAMQSKTAELF